MIVELQRFREEDAEFLVYLRNLPEMKRWFRQNHDLSIQEQHNFQSHISRESYLGFVIWAGKEPQVAEPVGLCALSKIDQMSGTAEFGIAVLPEFQGKGIATEALTKLLKHGFEDLNLRKIYSDVFIDNPALGWYTNKFGFVREGVLHKHYWKEGRYIDAVLIAKFRGDK